MAWSDAARRAAQLARDGQRRHGVRGSDYWTKRAREKLRGSAIGNWRKSVAARKANKLK